MRNTLFTIALATLIAAAPAYAGSLINKANLDKLQAAGEEMDDLVARTFDWQAMNMDEDDDDYDETPEDCRFDSAGLRQQLEERKLLQPMDAVARKHGFSGADQYFLLITTLTSAMMAEMYQSMLGAEAASESLGGSLSCVNEADIRAVAQHRQQIERIMEQMATRSMGTMENFTPPQQ